jgi:hypothetical protein
MERMASRWLVETMFPRQLLESRLQARLRLALAHYPLCQINQISQISHCQISTIADGRRIGQDWSYWICLAQLTAYYVHYLAIASHNPRPYESLARRCCCTLPACFFPFSSAAQSPSEAVPREMRIQHLSRLTSQGVDVTTLRACPLFRRPRSLLRRVLFPPYYLRWRM